MEYIKKTVLSGRNSQYNIIRKLKKQADVAVTLSIGERTYDEYKLWRKAGADRYLLKHEIADKDKYNNLNKLNKRI